MPFWEEKGDFLVKSAPKCHFLPSFGLLRRGVPIHRWKKNPLSWNQNPLSYMGVPRRKLALKTLKTAPVCRRGLTMTNQGIVLA
jgi:hypothetical protein